MGTGCCGSSLGSSLLCIAVCHSVLQPTVWVWWGCCCVENIEVVPDTWLMVWVWSCLFPACASSLSTAPALCCLFLLCLPRTLCLPVPQLLLCILTFLLIFSPADLSSRRTATLHCVPSPALWWTCSRLWMVMAHERLLRPYLWICCLELVYIPTRNSIFGKPSLRFL